MDLRKFLYISLFFICINAFAKNYYVKNGGNDEADGLSDATAWETIEKVNNHQHLLNPGDSILFKRGDIFHGTLITAKSGIQDNQIIYSAYDNGEMPVITGFKTVKAWKDEGGGIYSTVIACQSEPDYITINDQWFAMGRYPNNEYLTYETFSANRSITDQQLTSETNWTGAEAVIRKTNWILDRCKITDHTDQTLTYTSLGSSSNGTENFGYFFQNDIRTLDIFGEWYYEDSVMFIYFGEKDPSDYIIKIPVIDNLFYNSGFEYLITERLQFIGSARSSVFLTKGARYNQIQNCFFNFSGESSVKLINDVSHCVIYNNVIRNSVRAGIYGQSDRFSVIKNNHILNSGMLPGAYFSGTQNNGIYSGSSDDALIQYNVIDSSGYNGIYFTGNRAQLRNNFINNSVLLLNDGGGIYTQSLKFSGRVIEGNIVLNSFGNTSGSATISYGEGIYLDSGWSGVSDISVINNTVAGCRSNGFVFHDAINNTITGNLAFDNKTAVKYQNFASECKGNKMYDNVFIANTADQITLKVGLRFSTSNQFVHAYGNYYARPVDDDEHLQFWVTGSGWTNKTLAEWQTQSGEDADAKGAPVTVADTSMIRFYYNPTDEVRVIKMDTRMIDIDGNRIANELVIPAWRSLVLLAAPSVAGME